MKLAVDTNVLVRAVVGDDVAQAHKASQLLKNADVIAISITCLCEVCWVLRKVYGFSDEDIATAISALTETRNVEMNRPAVEAGLKVLGAGGDFADGVIAFEGAWLGAETFVSFDKHAVDLLQAGGANARLL